LRLGPQIQTLLSREGRCTGDGRTGQSRGGSGGPASRGGHVGSQTSTKTGNAPALEGDHFSWLRPAHADATQGRWQLSDLTADFFRPRRGLNRDRSEGPSDRCRPIAAGSACLREVAPGSAPPSPAHDQRRRLV